MACRLFGAKPIPEQNFDLMSVGTSITNFNEILFKILPKTKMYFELSGKWRPLYSGLTKWPPFRQTVVSKVFFNESDRIPIPIRISIDIKPALVQVMAWRREGDRPLPEPMQT